MKIFVCEFLTAGGLYRESLPASIVKEACMMRDALLYDLSSIAHVEILQTYDKRLPPKCLDQAIAIEVADDVWRVWDACIAAADAVWLIAPESDGILYKLAQRVASHGKPLIGANAEAIALTADKFLTFEALMKADIATVVTYKWSQQQDLVENEHGYVAKRIDGVSCEDSHFFATKQQLLNWMAQGRQQSHIMQPYILGTSASVCAIFHDAKAYVLSINKQFIVQEAGTFCYRGSILNVMPELSHALDGIVQKVAQTIEGLSAYIGLDVMVNDAGLQLLEINPRLTTSYAGLRQALGINPAALILEMHDTGSSPLWQQINRTQIEIHV